MTFNSWPGGEESAQPNKSQQIDFGFPKDWNLIDQMWLLERIHTLPGKMKEVLQLMDLGWDSNGNEDGCEMSWDGWVEMEGRTFWSSILPFTFSSPTLSHPGKPSLETLSEVHGPMKGPSPSLDSSIKALGFSGDPRSSSLLLPQPPPSFSSPRLTAFDLIFIRSPVLLRPPFVHFRLSMTPESAPRDFKKRNKRENGREILDSTLCIIVEIFEEEENGKRKSAFDGKTFKILRIFKSNHNL